MKIICDQLMKNLLINWDIEEENVKIVSLFGEKSLNLQIGYFFWKKTRKELNRRKVYNFFAYLVMVLIDLVGQSHFYVGIAIGLVNGRAVLMEEEVAICFLGLFL